MTVAASLLLYRWLLTSAALQSQFLGSDIFNNRSRDRYDFVIVGGGTAGCVLASRLSEIPEFNVLLLEKGNSGNDFSDVSLLMPDVDSEEFTESIPTVKQDHAWQRNGGIADFRTGKGLGGGSTSNALNFVRGSALDYNTWWRMGAEGWYHEDVLPFFKELEAHHPADGVHDVTYRGFNGPIDAETVTSFPHVIEAFLNAATERGYDIGDYNNKVHSFDAMQLSSLNGVRSSTRRAYLRMALNRPNLDFVCQATATRILFEGNRAIGVEYQRLGHLQKVWTDREVIVSASALRSPQLLMVSGVGPSAILNQFGIPVVKDLPGVGQNLQDHPAFTVSAVLKEPFYSHNLTLQDIHDYDNLKKGPLTETGLIGMGFLQNYQTNRTSIDEDIDTRYQIPMIALNSMSKEGRILDSSPLGDRFRPLSIISDDGSITLDTLVFESLLLVPDSRGNITISSDSIYDIPVIDPQVLANPRDREAAIDLLRTVLKFARTDALQSLGISSLITDPDQLCAHHEEESNEYFECVVKQYTKTGWHYCGTARIGSPDDPLAVVDPSLKVIGVQGLRVIDASVMPTIPRGNTNIPVIMIAEKGADMIKEEYGTSRRIFVLRHMDNEFVRLLNQTLPVARFPEGIAD